MSRQLSIAVVSGRRDRHRGDRGRAPLEGADVSLDATEFGWGSEHDKETGAMFRREESSV
jgi:hypothetical protein